MWSIKPTFQNHRGFTLIEVLLTISIIFILINPILGLFDLSLNIFAFEEYNNEISLNGKYAIEYIKSEIKMADKIIAVDNISGLKLKYPKNVGFIVLRIDNSGTKPIYNYSTYYENNNKLIRISANRLDNKYPTYGSFSGNNTVSEYLISLTNTKLDLNEGIIYLDFLFGTLENSIVFKSDLYLRCEYH